MGLTRGLMGRPGLSLTADGVGSLLLRSPSLKLVACRMSSPRISTPCFRGTLSVAARGPAGLWMLLV